MVLCLGEPLRRFLWCWLLFLILISFLYLHFIFDLHFVVVHHLPFFFIHIFFSTSSLTLPWAIARFLDPFCTFSSPYRRVIRDTFIFNHSVIFLPRALRFWVGIFYPQAFFTLRSFPTFLEQPAFIKVSLGAGSYFLESCRASYWSSKHRPGPSVCLIHSNPQSSYSERFSFKFYHILSWIACGESLIYLLLTRFELFSLVQSICKDY